MPTCLYCREDKDPSLFDREHVVPQAFGVFRNNFVLRDTVCHDCNQYFGNTLDIHLAQNSVEALDRYEQGLKQPKANTTIGRGDALLKATVNEGIYKGARVYWAPKVDSDGLGVYFPEQVGFIYGALRHWTSVDAIPTKDELRLLGIPPGASLEVVLTPGLEVDAVRGTMEARGYPVTFSPIATDELGDPSVGLDIKGTIDRRLQRAIAKISYNYLAYHYRPIAMMEPFDAIRRYIRYDALLPARPVSLKPGPIVRFGGSLARLAQDKDPVAHVATVEWLDGQVIGQVSLLYRFRYWVVLADHGFLIEPSCVAKGHMFNPAEHNIQDLQYLPTRR